MSSSKVLGSALMVGGGLLLAALVAKTVNNDSEPHFSDKPTTEAIGATATTMSLGEVNEEQKIAEVQQKNREAQLKADQEKAERLAEEAKQRQQQALSAAKDDAKVFDAPLQVQTRPEQPKPATKPESKSEPKKAEPPKADKKSTHTIVRGDTLSKLAKQYGINVEALAAYNNMGKNDNLALGRVIKIPDANVKLNEIAKKTETKTENRPEQKTETKPEPKPINNIKVGENHTVQSGDTLGHLARQYGVSVEDIVKLNGMNNADSLSAGAVIKIPAGGVKRPVVTPTKVEAKPVQKSEPKTETKAETKPAPKPAAGNSHTVQSGDTLGHLARTYGVSVEEIAKLNGMNNADSLSAGAVIKIPTGAKRTEPTKRTEPQKSEPKATQKTEAKAETKAPHKVTVQSGGNHTVQSGDTLGHLAKAYGVSVDDIAKANGMGKDDNLPAGKTLKIPNKKSQ